MAYRQIGSSWNSKMREDIDTMFAELYDEYTGAGLDATEAKEKALQAVADALIAKEDAATAKEMVQQIIDGEVDTGALVLEIERKLNELESQYAPDLNGLKTEVGEARGNEATLGDNLNSIKADLVQNTEEIGDKSTLPSWLQDSLREVTKLHDEYIRQFGVNVRQPPFNMKGDGTDDPSILQTIVDYAIEKGLPVIVPDGDYDFTDIGVHTYTAIRGNGRRTKLRHVGSGTAIRKPTGNAGYAQISNLTIELNQNTTIGVDMSGWFNAILTAVNIFGVENKGTGIFIGDGQTRSSYYMSFYDVYVAGTEKGFDLGLSANSNSLINCRTSNVHYPIIFGNNNVNNNRVIGGSFEKYLVGLELNGTHNVLIGSRFENPSTDGSNGTAIRIVGGYGNYIISPHLQGNLLDFEDLTDNKDTLIIYNSLDMGGRSVVNTSGITLKTQDSTAGGSKGRVSFFGEGVVGNEGLFYYDTTWRKVQKVAYHSTTTRPTSPRPGEMMFDATLGKPIWWSGSNWVDATGLVV